MLLVFVFLFSIFENPPDGSCDLSHRAKECKGGQCGPQVWARGAPSTQCSPPVPTQWYSVGQWPLTEHSGQWALSSV